MGAPCGCESEGDRMTILCLGLWWLFLLGKFRKSVHVFVLLLFLASGAYTVKNYYDIAHPRAMVTMDTQLHLGPDMKYASRTLLKKGDEVVIDSSYNGWCHIHYCTTDYAVTLWKLRFCRKTVRGWVVSESLQRKAPDL